MPDIARAWGVAPLASHLERWGAWVDRWLGHAADGWTWLFEWERHINVGTVWVAAISFTIFAAVKAVSWLVILNQDDQSDVGWALRRQKFWEALAFTTVASTYWLVLLGIHKGYQPEPWARMGLRVLIVLGLITASAYGIRFVIALLTLDRQSAPTAIMDQENPR